MATPPLPSPPPWFVHGLLWLALFQIDLSLVLVGKKSVFVFHTCIVVYAPAQRATNLSQIGQMSVASDNFKATNWYSTTPSNIVYSNLELAVTRVVLYPNASSDPFQSVRPRVCGKTVVLARTGRGWLSWDCCVPSDCLFSLSLSLSCLGQGSRALGCESWLTRGHRCHMPAPLGRRTCSRA